MTRSARPHLQLESLEAREVLSVTLIETFNNTFPPQLPSDWTQSSNNLSTVFSTATDLGVNQSGALLAIAGSRTAGLTWYNQLVSADTGATVLLKADSLIPAFVFARGSNVETSTPSYLAAVVTRGLKVELWEVTAGSARILDSVTSPPAVYLSGPWVEVAIIPTGNTVAVQVIRQDTGQYLNSQGRWENTSTTVIEATTSLPAVDGYVGVGRASAYAGTVRFDNFGLIAPPLAGVSQSFDTTATGSIPTDWSIWQSTPSSTFGANPIRAISPANGFTSSGTSLTRARAWANTILPADVAASSAVYLDSLIPARVFVRGSNLSGATPTYYMASITRGLEVQLIRVVNGVETVLGSLRSLSYLSGQWVRVRLSAEGDLLRVSVFRPDTQQWLAPDGVWVESPDFAVEKRDTAIAGEGQVGVERGASYAGVLTFDDFEAHPAGTAYAPRVTITATPDSTPLAGDVTFRANVTGSPTRIEFRLNGQLRSVATASPAEWTLDTTTLTNGSHTLTVRAFDTAGNMGTADYTFTTDNPGLGPIFKPTIPRHYEHIRIAQLAYSGNPMGSFERSLLQSSVDLVVANPQFLATIDAIAPNTPQLIYSNVSNLYGNLLIDWLTYADRDRLARELAFYHVTKATPFVGSSPSSQPVNWFWGVYQTVPGGSPVDVTAAARGGRNFNVSFGSSGTTTAIGYTDMFREMNITLIRGAGSDWSGVWEYAAAVDGTGLPTKWKQLSLLQDRTIGLKQSGTITFDPPADWVPSAITTDSNRLYYVRFRVTNGTTAQQPEVRTIFGRDYVQANGTNAGVIPAFDYAADRDHDGYLNDAEYASRTAGMDARFVYESRLFYPYYGQMRFVTNPSAPAVRRWAADYHVRLLNANPLADGIFMDNATGRVPFPGVSVLEPTATFSSDSGVLMAAVSRAIEPRWVLANTAGGGVNATPVAAGAAGVFEEFLLRPLQANWSQVGDVVDLINSRLATSSSPYLVLDSHPAGGSPTDSRTQLATLAYYYLVADPERTFLMFYGGFSPSSSWTQHWSPAAAVGIGQPTGVMRVFATGTDPSNTALTYRVLARDYENALVLYKPRSYAPGVGTGTLGNNTVTTHMLGGRYRKVNADGTLGPVVTAIALRNGEGAVLVRA
jgi:hypothetical protein